MTMTALCSWLLAVAKAGIPHLLALLIALWAGWWVYQRGQNQRLDRLLAALLADSSQNLTLLCAVIERESWRLDVIDSRLANPSVAQALSSDASLYASDLDRGLVMALLVYRDAIEASRSTMEYMRGRFIAERHLSPEHLGTLDRICRNAIAATRVLQSRLDLQMKARKIKLGTRDQAHEFLEEFRSEVQRVGSEVRRPSTN